MNEKPVMAAASISRNTFVENSLPLVFWSMAMNDDSSYKIKSVGIDIGTTTTQMIVSDLTVRNISPGSLVPRLKITDKAVRYKSNIYFTP